MYPAPGVGTLCIIMKFIPYIVFLVILLSCNHSERNQKKMIKSTATAIVQEEKSMTSQKKEIKTLRIKNPKKFEHYKVKVYNGILSDPNFKNDPFGDDKEYVQFITNAAKRLGINYNGHFTILTRSCGTQCVQLLLIDRINGRIFNDIKPNDGRDGFEFRKDSKLLIANSNLFTDSTFIEYVDYMNKPEYYVWDKDNFRILK